MDQTTYRIRTTIGDTKPFRISVPIRQTYDIMEILSLKIRQQNLYKLPQSEYGVVIGRVLANGNFGIPNAKISIFIPYSGDFISDKRFLYPYTTTMSTDDKGVRYNLLQTETGDACHQDVGSFPTKRYVLDNNDVIEVFEEFYTYTTSTNNAGDYMIYGVPTGMQDLHVDIDLSDIGVLSQSPRDMVYKGYDIKQFETPTKFRKSENLNSLSQILTQNQSVYVYPFWGDTTDSETNASITRCDIKIDYKFEPTCVFMGSVVTDSNSNFISKRCNPTKNAGKMSDLRTGEGMIEMIRKTPTNKVESFAVQGNRVIDGNGVWCYQIPMNLDYVMTDEFGNMVPTDDPENGIPTRTRVRFRLSMDELEGDMSGAKRARYLIPNNPEIPGVSDSHIDSDEDIDYEFGSKTKDISFRDLFWNHVYTVKGYIPRLQKSALPTTRHFTGIKATNHYGDNNPMPYNNMQIRLNFLYRINCMIAFVIVSIVTILNRIITGLGRIFWLLSGDGLKANCKCKGLRKDVLNFFADFFKAIFGGWLFTPVWQTIGCGIELKGWCQDDDEGKAYYPGCSHEKENDSNRNVQPIGAGDDDGSGEDEGDCQEPKCTVAILSLNNGSPYLNAVKDYYSSKGWNTNIETNANNLMQCVQSELAAENECVMMNFHNDWLNGALYLPLWGRKIRKRKFNIFGYKISRIKDIYCNGSVDNFIGIKNIDGYTTKVVEKEPKGLRLYNTCSQKREFDDNGKRLKPLASYNPPNSISDPITGIEVGKEIPSGQKEADCYGYNCDKMVGSNKINRGIIVERDTILQESVYYYKPINITKSEKIKMFATDIVLLGTLNNCDKNGTPQFFSKLSSTTYKMPPDLVVNDYETYSDAQVGYSIAGNQQKKFKLSETGVNENDMFAELSGADWGGNGKKQQEYFKDGFIDKKTLSSGLFYGITCNFTSVAPKSCINISRVCEFGVGLDESIYIYDSSTDNHQQYIAPDGFISTDEINDIDGRSMFATLNGNNLKTIVDTKTGYSIYDFNFSYQQYFDNSIKNIMTTFLTGLNEVNTYRNNYKLENYSEDYVKFRYGEFNGQSSFYNTDFSSPLNGPRIPKYNNSFYFYFGLKEGKTSIDKFRELYYNECKSETTEDAIDLLYKPNEWCDEIEAGEPEGFIRLDMTYVDTPYTINIDCRSDNEYDKVVSGITKPRIYIGPEGIQDPELEGYECLLDENGEAIQIINGSYIITVIDANSETTSFNVYLMPEAISCDIIHESFKIPDEQLFDENNGYCICTGSSDADYYCIAKYVNQQTNEREIGGVITVSNISVSNFRIEIKPVVGSVFNDFDGTTTYEGDVYDSDEETSEHGTLIFKMNGTYTFGMPKGNTTYIVTVTEICESEGNRIPSRNIYSNQVFVEKYELPIMYINGIDSRLLKYFKTGFNDNVIQPYTPSDDDEYVQSRMEASKWFYGIRNIGTITETIPYDIEGEMPSYESIESTINYLSRRHLDDTYYWTDEYMFVENKAEDLINITIIDRIQQIDGRNVDITIIPDDSVPIPPDTNIEDIPHQDTLKNINWSYVFGPYSQGQWPTYFKSSKSNATGEIYKFFELVTPSIAVRYGYYKTKQEQNVTVEEFYLAPETNNESKAVIIDYINGIINNRVNLPRAMQLAFWKSGTSKDIEIVSTSTNFPNKYLVYGPIINNIVKEPVIPEKVIIKDEYPGQPEDEAYFVVILGTATLEDISGMIKILWSDKESEYYNLDRFANQFVDFDIWHISKGYSIWNLQLPVGTKKARISQYKSEFLIYYQDKIDLEYQNIDTEPKESVTHNFGILDNNRESNNFSFDHGQLVFNNTDHGIDFNWMDYVVDNDVLSMFTVDPFYCSTMDNAEFVVPKALSVDEFNTGALTLNNLCGVMFVEHPLAVGVVTWGAVKHPIAYNSMGNTTGSFISKAGILDSYIHNGIVKSKDYNMTTYFDAQTIDNSDISIVTTDDDEYIEIVHRHNYMPISTDMLNASSEIDYFNYPKIQLRDNEYPHMVHEYPLYTKIPNAASELTIGDETYKILDTCYGNIKIEINPNSLLHNINNLQHVVNFKITNNNPDIDLDRSIIILFYDENAYPIMPDYRQLAEDNILFTEIVFDKLNMHPENNYYIISELSPLWNVEHEGPIHTFDNMVVDTGKTFFAVCILVNNNTNVSCAYTPLYEYKITNMSVNSEKTVSITSTNRYLRQFTCDITVSNDMIQITKTNIRLEFDGNNVATYTFTTQNWFNIGDSVRITVKDVTGLEHYKDTTVA